MDAIFLMDLVSLQNVFMKLYHNFFNKPWNIFKINIEFKEVFIVNKWVSNHELVLFRSGLTWFYLEMNWVWNMTKKEINFEIFWELVELCEVNLLWLIKYDVRWYVGMS